MRAEAKPERPAEGFFEYDIRAGTVVRVEEFPEARKPAYKIWVHFGEEVGEKQSSAAITDLYGVEDLVGRQVAAVINFPPRRIGPFTSEVLILGVDTPDGVVLLHPDRGVAPGSPIF